MKEESPGASFGECQRLSAVLHHRQHHRLSAAGFLAFGLVGRMAQHAIRTYRVVAVIALGTSFLSPVCALTGLLPVAGMTLPIFWTMVTMHTVTAIIAVGMLTTLAVTSSRGTRARSVAN